MAINKTNLYSQTWIAIRDFLKNNMTDPVRNSKNSTRKWIYNRVPLVGSNFKGFPFIHVSDLTLPDNFKTFGKGLYFHTCRAVITIISKEQENTGNSPQLDTLSNELNLAVKDETTLDSEGIKNIEITDIGVDDTEFGGAMVRVRTFTLEADVPVNYT